MLKNIFNKKQYSNESLLEELFQHDFDENILKDILASSNVDINYQDTKGNSFLHICLEKSKFKSAFWLIKNKINVKLCNNKNQMALDIAIEQNNKQIVEIILSLNKIDINKKDKFGRTLLQNTVVLGYNEMAEILIEHGADINSKDIHNRNVIFDALSYGNEKFIDYLLKYQVLMLNNVDANHDSIMHHPQVKQNDILANKLIEKGANPTIKNSKGATFLCDTALRGMDGYELINTALKHGVDINSRVAHNNTILMELISASTNLSVNEQEKRDSLIDMSKFILLNGMDINAIDDAQESALFRAIRVNDIELVSFLLSEGVDPNVQNIHSQTVLNEIAYKGADSLNILILLLRHKADPNIKDDKGRTLYEILNEIILQVHNKKPMTDQFLLSKINKEGHYMVVLKELLSRNKKDINYLDSTGNPLFFNPLICDHSALFRLYIKSGLNIHTLNKEKHNIFFEYVLKVFESDIEYDEFQSNISMLLSAKLEHNYQDDKGRTVVNKIIFTKCNRNLFKILVSVVRFNYNLTDHLGRSVMHDAVWNDKKNIIKIIHEINNEVVNIPDNYGILPITYAALLGNQELVLLFIELNANIKSGITIPQNAHDRFSPMLKNLNTLLLNIEDGDILNKMEIVIDQVTRDFNLKQECNNC